MSDPHRVLLQPGYVLHRVPYRETSLLVDVFTPDWGRLRVLAKGARRGRGGLGVLLQSFRPVRLSWSGRGNLPVLTDAESREGPATPPGMGLYCGFYMNELLLRLLAEHDPHPELFEHYAATLARLANAGGEEDALRGFEIALLDQLGYGLSLEVDATQGRPIEPNRRYRYHIESGPIEVASGDTDTLSGATLLALRSGQLNRPELRLEAKRLMRFVLHHHLHGRPLKSRELFKSISRN